MTTNDKQAGKQGLVPRLRFPEFATSGGWRKATLKNLCSMQAGQFVKASEIVAKSSPELYPCFGGNGLRGYTQTYTHDGHYSLIGRQGALCGNVTRVDGRFHATEHAVVVTPERGTSEDWLYYALDGLKLNGFATGQAQPGLSVAVLDTVSCSVPSTHDEQQKIADCLSSLDARIDAETRRLDALKTHKQGLLQQLFPRPTETTPRRRFSDFHEPWRSTTLGAEALFLRGRGVAKDDVDANGSTPCIRYGELYTSYGEVVHEVVSRTRIAPRDAVLSKVGDVIVPTSGETKEDIATSACVMVDGVALGSDLLILRSPMIGPFLSYYIRGVLRKRIAKVAQGDSVVHLYRAQLEKVAFNLPTNAEQQKIADCLTSLDDLIAAQAKKIDLLMQHKRGLMQQMFPVVE